ncbi:hypothetical protein NLJ89_g11651 [Agrocybe chaxingu]|uniref:C2H2-type domain-containing protein n=1 Tax=Agrocybe chaxingu TaxID=84603 RepID=A0A9W8MPT7_9AGAR|nr:hypothetical protein NLJ89_g11651 [Agrocybe chaxingu]
MDTSVSSDFAAVLRVYVGSDESDSDESGIDASDMEDTHRHVQCVDKGKGRAVEPGPAPGWEANVEGGDFLDDDRYLCVVDPREVCRVEEGVCAGLGAEEGGLDEDNGQDDCMENDDAEVPPTAGPSTGAACYHGAGPITPAPVAWGTLQRNNTQEFMIEGSSALANEQPNRLPSNIGAKRKRAANNDDGTDERTKEVPVVPGTPLHARMSDAALQEAYSGSTKHPHAKKTSEDFGCRVWPGQPGAKWCCHFCPYALQERSSIRRHVRAHHYAGTFSCEPYGCLCGEAFVTSRRELLERHLRTDWTNSKRRKTGEAKAKNVKRGEEGKM